MKINISFLSLLFLFLMPSIYIAQDCACKYWKKTYYDSNGKVNYEYQHGCQQPSFAYEYIGYDNDYCNELAEKEKRKIIREKNFNEANKILNNTKKILEKDGFKVISWWGKQLGNTEHWGLVGKPRCGIKADSTIISWNEDSSIRFEGKIKNSRLDGLIKFNAGPFYDLVKIGEHLDLYISDTEPDYIYYNEKEQFDSFSNTLKHYKVRRRPGGDNSIEYIDDNGNWTPCYYYLFSNDIDIIFTRPIDETKALEIKELIKKEEIKKSKEILTVHKNRLDKIIKKYSSIKESFTQIKTHQLNSVEQSIVGKWNLATSSVSANWYDRKEDIKLDESIDFKNNNSFTYTFELSSLFYTNQITIKKVQKEGYWFYKDDKIYLIPEETDFYNNIGTNIDKVEKGLPYLSKLITAIDKAILEEKIWKNYSGDNDLDYNITLDSGLAKEENFAGMRLSYEKEESLNRDFFKESIIEVPFNLIGIEKIKKSDYFLYDSLYFLLDKNNSKELAEQFKDIVVFDLLKGKKEKQEITR